MKTRDANSLDRAGADPSIPKKKQTPAGKAVRKKNVTTSRGGGVGLKVTIFKGQEKFSGATPGGGKGPVTAGKKTSLRGNGVVTKGQNGPRKRGAASRKQN